MFLWIDIVYSDLYDSVVVFGFSCSFFGSNIRFLMFFDCCQLSRVFKKNFRWSSTSFGFNGVVLLAHLLDSLCHLSSNSGYLQKREVSENKLFMVPMCIEHLLHSSSWGSLSFPFSGSVFFSSIEWICWRTRFWFCFWFIRYPFIGHLNESVGELDFWRQVLGARRLIKGVLTMIVCQFFVAVFVLGLSVVPLSVIPSYGFFLYLTVVKFCSFRICLCFFLVWPVRRPSKSS